MDAILDLPPGLPPHDAAPLSPVPHRIVSEWPVGTFVENLAVLPDGDIAVSVLTEARLDLVRPSGETRTLHQFDAPPTGLAMMGGALFVAVGEPGAGAPTLWRVEPATGAAAPWMVLEGLQFANGVTPFAPGQLLVADSWLGQLLLVDLDARTSVVWLADERLTRAPALDFLPGANGVKRYGRVVTVSSNGRALLLEADVDATGAATGLRVVAERLRVDDLAYDAQGGRYLTTHIGHSVDRLGADGTRIAVGGVAEGLAGSTACAFHPDGGLYVTTTGGIIAPPGRQLQTAKLVRLEVGTAGHDLNRAWERRA